MIPALHPTSVDLGAKVPREAFLRRSTSADYGCQQRLTGPTGFGRLDCAGLDQ